MKQIKLNRLASCGKYFSKATRYKQKKYSKHTASLTCIEEWWIQVRREKTAYHQPDTTPSLDTVNTHSPITAQY